MGSHLTDRGEGTGGQLARGVVVEFVGLPGSGKSAISHRVAALLRDRGFQVFEPTYVMDRRPTLQRQARKALLAAEGAIRARRATRFWLGPILRSRPGRPAAYPELIINQFYIQAILARVQRRGGVHVLDQGLIQGLWSIGWEARRPPTLQGPQWTEAIGIVLPPSYVVVLLEAGPEVIRERLQRRRGGASPLDVAQRSDDWPQAVARAQALMEELGAYVTALSARLGVTFLRLRSARNGSKAALATRITEAILRGLPAGNASPR